MSKSNLSISLAAKKIVAKETIISVASKRSAVALVVDSDDFHSASLLFIQRAKSEKDPWSGHMAFPGGRYELTDQDTLFTAKREMHEEVGFDIDSEVNAQFNPRLLTRLSDISPFSWSKFKTIIVTPYLFLIDGKPSLTPNYEVETTVWIPLSFFLDKSNRQQKTFTNFGISISTPAYVWQENMVIWGMSLRMIDELLAAEGFVFS